MSNKVYIGDAVYAQFDGFGVWLSTQRGYRAEEKIYLEPTVLANLLHHWSEAYKIKFVAKPLEEK